MDERAFEAKLEAFWDLFFDHCLDGETMHHFLSGKLNQGEPLAVARHLALCERCAVVQEDVVEALQVLRQREEKESAAHACHLLLSEKFFRLAERSSKTLASFFSKTVSFSESLNLAALAPLALQPAFADTGREFEKDSKASDESPFDIEFTVFGRRLEVRVRSRSPLYDHSVVRFHLKEGTRVHFSGVLLVSDGRGIFETTLSKIPLPKTSRLAVEIEPIHALDLLAKLEEEASVEVLGRLLRESDPSVRLACVELLANVNTPRAQDLLESATNDPELAVREAVRKALS